MSLDNQKMPNWVLQHRIFCVEHYFRTSSYESVKTQFRTSFQTEVAPDKSLIYRWVEKFRKHGTVQNLNSKSDDRQTHSGRPKKRTTEVIEMVRNSVEFSPKRSIRRRSQSLSLDRKISPSTVRRVLINDLKRFPYRIQTKQKLTTANKSKRLQIAKKFLEKIQSQDRFLSLLWISDEAHFHLNGKVNSKTNVFWGTQRPIEVAEKPLHSEKCTAWAAISAKGIIGPFFFEENHKAVTITKERYVQVLDLILQQLKILYPSLLTHFWFQQDGASSHTSYFSRDWLKEHFGSRVISLKTDFEWPPYSPDLSPPDFYLWGFLKDRVYTTKPRTISELKENIRGEIRKIPSSVCKDVMNNFVVWLKKCTELKGGHLEHLL